MKEALNSLLFFAITLLLIVVLCITCSNNKISLALIKFAGEDNKTSEINSQKNEGVNTSPRVDALSTSISQTNTVTGTLTTNLNTGKGKENNMINAFWGDYGTWLNLSWFLLIRILMTAIGVVILAYFLPIFIKPLTFISSFYRSILSILIIFGVRFLVSFIWKTPTGQIILDCVLGYGLNVILYSIVIKKKFLQLKAKNIK